MDDNNSNSIAVRSPAELIERALVGNASIEVLERLLALQERWQEREARAQFDAAMAAFRAECPATVKKATKNPFTNSKYASLEDVADTAAPHLAKNGLHYRWSMRLEGEMIWVRCELVHTGGGMIACEVGDKRESGRGHNSKMNAVQAMRSTTSYLKRITLESVTGLVPADDDDGNAAGEPGEPTPFRGVDRSTTTTRPAAAKEPPPPSPEPWDEPPPATEPPEKPSTKPSRSKKAEKKSAELTPSVATSLEHARALIENEDGDLELAHAELQAAIVNSTSTHDLDSIAATIATFLDACEPDNRESLRAGLLAQWKAKKIGKQ